MKAVGSKVGEMHIAEIERIEELVDQLKPLNGPPTDPALMELLTWVGEHIKLVNALGKKSDRFCIFCRRSQTPNKNCRHNEIWERTGTKP